MNLKLLIMRFVKGGTSHLLLVKIFNRSS